MVMGSKQDDSFNDNTETKLQFPSVVDNKTSKRVL